MKTIKDAEELIRVMVEEKWFRREENPLASSNYKTLHYECGCGDYHILRDTRFILIGTPVKFVFQCDNDYLTAVKVKGFFRQTSIELWSCTVDLYLEATELINNEG